MSDIKHMDLGKCCSMFAIANTPHFLIRGLRQDATVQNIASSISSKEIFDALREAMNSDPQTLEDYVRPYVYVTALSIKADYAFLNMLPSLPNKQKWDWLEYVIKLSLETHLPTNIKQFKIPGQITSPMVSANSSSPIIYLSGVA